MLMVSQFTELSKSKKLMASNFLCTSQLLHKIFACVFNVNVHSAQFMNTNVDG